MGHRQEQAIEMLDCIEYLIEGSILRMEHNYVPSSLKVHIYAYPSPAVARLSSNGMVHGRKQFR